MPKEYIENIKKISIHAAREGGDTVNVSSKPTADISIHAAREGGDCIERDFVLDICYFNPRRP